jgi:hypothetical protein
MICGFAPFWEEGAPLIIMKYGTETKWSLGEANIAALAALAELAALCFANDTVVLSRHISHGARALPNTK